MIDERYKDIDNLSDEELVNLVLEDERPEFFRTKFSVYFAKNGGLECSKPMEYSEYVPQLRKAIKMGKNFIYRFVYADNMYDYSNDFIKAHPERFFDRHEIVIE